MWVKIADEPRPFISSMLEAKSSDANWEIGLWVYEYGVKPVS